MLQPFSVENFEFGLSIRHFSGPTDITIITCLVLLLLLFMIAFENIFHKWKML